MESIIKFHRKNPEVGSLGKPSKMPGFAYGLSAFDCKVGAKLREVEGSTCNKCYATRGHYLYANVKKAQAVRLHSLDEAQWVLAMVEKIRETTTGYFRWHDSGDLQSLQHLFQIVAVAEALPEVKFWMPTREKAIVNEYLRTFGDFPENLTVRVSAAMIGGEPPAGFPQTSTVHKKTMVPVGHVCPSNMNAGKCGECRACWDKSVDNVSYPYH
jgi:hypothetical protein